MPGIPTTFYRKTKHKKPRHQLYVPGFNPANSCWLDGSWVTFPKEVWKERHKAHHRTFKAATKGHGRQHWRDPETPLDALTEAQRMAYEHYSGEQSLYAVYGNGNVGPIAVEMAGNEPRPDQVKWLREQGLQILRFTKNGHTGEVTDTLKGLDFPPDLVHPSKKPRDPWATIVDQNKRQQKEMHDACVEGAINGVEGMPAEAQGFMAQMAFTGLIQKEASIIRSEWSQHRDINDPYADLDRDVREYVEMRASLEESFGDQFATWYDRARASHNKCARANLDNSNGLLFSYVLPEFNADGTHEPWGPRDVPWSQDGA
jgi:hypothetical protein